MTTAKLAEFTLHFLVGLLLGYYSRPLISTFLSVLIFDIAVIYLRWHHKKESVQK